uniref:Arf-GAP domain-containing protein n=1 Tax=Chaetoceros debilis TaxID=122233 RepID=A0A7S3V6J9_9STRA|mmetsp:Transcript_20476/g.31070  ORF Transcript_20476/g.31070 Transcript_20476/m.31070 type:complete len:516 (+) Transcript_20476:46-1593(+)|eukprot:CAMPEP_0194074500 /NCGR_PEP_ID=MMETSP0149-20130528/1622_1 /TAXON_ID=122233 /ORGANISM="Chaetoceros debilis, Strain MM31A-1" /LENGTH=515 /DNA_ID=CAMNT_0038754705 /DNA_START=44 /DNA_END=1591 /DNA_ORIENTATION=-
MMDVMAPLPPIQTKQMGDDIEFVMKDMTPRSRANESQAKLKRRVKRLMNKKENKLCLDCSKPKPKWATLISISHVHGGRLDAVGDTYYIGGLCCLECSGAHRRLGTHLSFVRSTELDTLKDHEVKALEYGGNSVINGIYEGNMFDTSAIDSAMNEISVTDILKPDSTSGQKAREAFIRNKYEKRKYLNIKALAKFRQSMLHRGIRSPIALASPAPEHISPKSEQSASPIQLQIFTSSPRTLALIEKYMNAKPKKKKGLGRMRFPLRKVSKNNFLKGSVRNLRDEADLTTTVNPRLNIAETRSEEFDSSDSDSDTDADDRSDECSVSSTKSSMSATLRRRILRSKKCSTSKAADMLQSTPPSMKSSITPTLSTPVQKKRNIFHRRQSNKLSQHSAEEIEMFDTNKDVFSPSPTASSNGSMRARLPQLLHTPKFKNAKPESGNSSEKKRGKRKIFFSEDTLGLEIVEEDTPSNQSVAGSCYREEIRAMEAWSRKFDKLLGKVFRKRRTPTGKTREVV